MSLRQRLIDLLLLLLIAATVLGGLEVGWRLREHHQLVNAILNTLRQAQQPKAPQGLPPP